MRHCHAARPETLSAPQASATLAAAVPAPSAACTSRAQAQVAASPSLFQKFRERIEELTGWMNEGILTPAEREREVAKAKEHFGIGK